LVYQNIDEHRAETAVDFATMQKKRKPTWRKYKRAALRSKYKEEH